MRFQRMSDDNIMPIGQFRASCPLCEARLSIEHQISKETSPCSVPSTELREALRKRVGLSTNYVIDSAKKIARAIMKTKLALVHLARH
jgi:hypothetical protein